MLMCMHLYNCGNVCMDVYICACEEVCVCMNVSLCVWGCMNLFA